MATWTLNLSLANKQRQLNQRWARWPNEDNIIALGQDARPTQNWLPSVPFTSMGLRLKPYEWDSMDQNWHTNQTTTAVLDAARCLSTQGVPTLGWTVTQLVRAASSTTTGTAQETAVLALAACQQAMILCTSDMDMTVPSIPLGISNAATSKANRSIAGGANEIGDAGPDGLRMLVENVLPPIHQAVREFQGDKLVHEISTWFLMALSVGPHNRGPEPHVHHGLLLSYPVPEPQMNWA